MRLLKSRFAVLFLFLLAGCLTPPNGGETGGKADTLLWIVNLERSLERTPQNSALLKDYSYWREIGDAGHKWVIVDVDANPETAASYQKQIDKVGSLPCTVLLNADTKKVLTQQKTPNDRETMNKLIAKHWRKKQ